MNTKRALLFLVSVIMSLTFVACGIDIDTTSVSDVSKTQSVSNAESGFLIDVTTQSNDKWKMTYKECQTKSKLNSFTHAEDGSEFVIVFFEIENISEESQNFSGFNTDFYFDDIKTVQSAYGSSIDHSLQLFAVTVEPSRKVNGYFLFEISTNWNKLEIIYNESLYKEENDNVMKFTLSKHIS